MTADGPRGPSILKSLLTCPHCGYAKLETMPTDACQVIYECLNCRALLRPNTGDCCVFCSFLSEVPADPTATRLLQ